MKAFTEEQNVRSPKSPPNISDPIATLKQLEGTEYIPSGFWDEESTNLLSQIDSVLQVAGWKRVNCDFGEQMRPSGQLRLPDRRNLMDDKEKRLRKAIGDLRCYAKNLKNPC